MHDFSDKNLIFIISQPRSGSTLLQTLLSKQSQITTLPETWILLPLLSILKPDMTIADYNSLSAQRAISNFIAALPNAYESYHEAIRRMVLHLYEQACYGSQAQYFIDKTPRYYYIIEEIRTVFPNALIIILYRNPLAVLCSLIDRKQGNWYQLQFNRHDLLEAPRYLLEATKLTESNTIVLRYEDYLRNPVCLHQIFEHLNLSIPEDLTRYELEEQEEHSFPTFGDDKIHQAAEIVPARAESWISKLEDPQTWRLAHDYLHYLGRDTITQMGYDFDELQEILQSHTPAPLWKHTTMPLLWLLEQSNTRTNRRAWRHRIYRMAKRLRTHFSRS